MKNFKDEYKNYYNKMEFSQKSKNKIFENIINNSQNSSKLKIKSWKQKIAIVSCSLLAVFLIGTGIVFAKEFVKKINHVYNLIPSENGTTNYKCTISPLVLEGVNNIDINENKILTIEELSKTLNKHILSSEKIEDTTFSVIRTLEKDNHLVYAYLSKNGISAPKFIPESWDITTLEMNLSFLTSYASQKDIKDLIEFEVGNCSDDNFDEVYIDSLDINVYLYKTKVIAYAYGDSIEFMVRAYFVYDDILYNINGAIISRDMIIDFINSLK